MSGGDDAPVATSTSVTEPFAQQLPFIQQVFGEADKQFRAPGPSFFPGSQVASQQPETLGAQNFLRDFAQGPAVDFANAALGANQFALGPVLFPETNPALQANIEGAIRPVFQQLTEDVLPQIQDQAIAAGGTGGSRQGVAEGLAISRANQSALDTSAQLSNQAFQGGLDLFGRGLGLAPQTLQTATAPATILDAVGSQNQNFEQSLINDLVNRHSFDQNVDAAKLAQFANLVGGNFGSTAFNTASGGSTGSGAAGLLGGALSGGTLGNQLFPGNAGTATGAGLGLLLSLFG